MKNGEIGLIITLYRIKMKKKIKEKDVTAFNKKMYNFQTKEKSIAEGLDKFPL